jgi:hypothetical protein
MHDPIAGGTPAGVVLISGILFTVSVAGALFPAQVSAQQPLSERDAEARVAQMRELVAAMTVRDLSQEQPRTAELIAEPLVHYTDQERRFADATLWGWQVEGRPVAFSKLERIISLADGGIGWQYCLVSLSEGLIEVRGEARDSWRASKAGLSWRELTNAPQPHRTESGRLVQMKGLARRFDAVIINPELEQRERMRLLPTPIMRYSSESQHVSDGGIFGFTSKGTNPDTLLLIELQGTGVESEWNYTVVGMTGDAVTVEREGQTVWSKDATPGPGDHDNWMWRVEWDTAQSE